MGTSVFLSHRPADPRGVLLKPAFFTDPPDHKEGEILALENGKLMFTDTDIHHAAVKLAKSMINSRRISGREVAFITLMYGEGMTEEDAEAVRDAITAKAGDNVDITLVDGGQPVYYYFISIE